MNKKKIALIGNPNVGKSTVYNALTGMHQHTGNWPGKTVEQAIGCFKTSKYEYELIDLPGTYSLFSTSLEETITRDFILDGDYDLIVVIMDATALSRTLLLGLQVARKSKHILFVINLMDEAHRLGIKVNTTVLAKNCGIPSIGINATSKRDIKALKEFIDEHIDQENELVSFKDSIELQYRKTQEICHVCVTQSKPRMRSKLDEWLVHPVIGSLLMLGMLGVICFLTISGANVPSRILGEIFTDLGVYLRTGLVYWGVSPWWVGLWMDGVYLILSFVVSVMFPPMVIFFTLFSFLEEYGLLPRIAFCLDGCFEKCHGHGKQSLCMCMGLGCNCVGVSGCRIMESKRDRDIGMITNSFMPCNGRFPMIITIASIFLGIRGIDSVLTSSLVLTACICISIASVFLVTYVLSIFIYKGERGSFVLELPPYRIPHIKTILTHSLFHKTFSILGRAIVVSSIAGAVIYIVSPYLHYMVSFLNPIGYFIGVDGEVLLSFILGAPANEIVMPIMLMVYKGTSTIVSLDLEATREILLLNGWTIHKAICFIILVLFHFPCTTTLLTIYKETKNKKTLLLSIIVPALYGIGLCILITMIG